MILKKQVSYHIYTYKNKIGKKIRIEKCGNRVKES